MVGDAQEAGPSRPPEVQSTKSRTVQRGEESTNDSKGSLILRIKRKRGTDPISALRIETLLSEGIDPSQVESHARQLERGEGGSPEDRPERVGGVKRRLTERGIFRLADTVSLSSFADEASTRQLERRISELKKAPSSHPVSQEIAALDSVKEPVVTSQQSVPANSTNKSLRFKVIRPTSKEWIKQGLTGTLKNKSSSSSLRSRAAQIKLSRNTSKSSLSSLRKSSEISNISRKSSYASKIRFIDAVMERSRVGSKQKREEGRTRLVEKASAGSSKDAEMDSLDQRFADLLGNYLKENDLEPPKDLYDSSLISGQQQDSQSSSEDSEDDYVYDIYIREKESMWGYGPAGASDAGLYPAEVVGREGKSVNMPAPTFAVGQAVPAEAQYRMEAMATLVGFSDEDDLISEMEKASTLMAREVPGDSDDDFDEGEDEDSNDEGFYRNDYPEDEGEEEDEMNQAGWGWSGPRRRGQRSSSSEDEEKDSEDDESDL